MSEGAPRNVGGGEAAAARPEPIHPRPPSPVAEARPRKVSNLVLRLVSAGLLIPPVVFAIWEGGLWVLGVVVVFTLLGLREFYHLIEQKGAHPLRSFGMAAGAALPVVAYLGSEYHATVLMTVVLLAMMVMQLSKSQISEALESISGTFFGVFYVGWLLSHAVVLREFSSVAAGKWTDAALALMHPEVGAFYLFFAISVVVMGDVGAYFAGRAWGRHKLAPNVSPGKTVEGAVGAVLAATLLGLVLKGLCDRFLPDLSAQLGWWATGLVAFTLAVVGIIGDLVESLLKRDAEVKDAGSLLPGMGGILDRIDSNLLAIPVMYYLMLAYTYLELGPPGALR